MVGTGENTYLQLNTLIHLKLNMNLKNPNNYNVLSKELVPIPKLKDNCICYAKYYSV